MRLAGAERGAAGELGSLSEEVELSAARMNRCVSSVWPDSVRVLDKLLPAHGQSPGVATTV